ncbi:MAG TPA: ATP-grasp domain-containing protein [Micropepsaceae bacterium]|jgi:biotin carboxylase
MTRTLLIISGGIEAVDAIKRARDMGLHVVVSDIAADAPGFAHAHDRIIADVYGAEETLQAVERYVREQRPIDGVLCVAADAPVTAARIAGKLKLPGISVATAKLACDKLAMKRRFKECGVPVPWFAAVASAAELAAIVAERGADLVIKPVDSRGSRGVQRLSRSPDIAGAFALAQKHSPTGRVMVEAYLDGPQISTESIVTRGRCHTPGFADRNYELLEVHAPFFTENGGDLPSHLPQDIQQKVKDVIAGAATVLGVTDGTVKGDVVVHRGQPYVIELAARLSGGFFCTLEIPLNTGVDFIGCAIRVALGETIAAAELEPSRQQPVIQRYAFPKAGRVIAIRGADTAKNLPGIAGIIVTARPGDIIPPAGDKRPSAAMVLATGTTHAAALAAAHAGVAAIEIETQ